jgi:hypothetical protein
MPTACEVREPTMLSPEGSGEEQVFSVPTLECQVYEQIPLAFEETKFELTEPPPTDWEAVRVAWDRKPE